MTVKERILERIMALEGRATKNFLHLERFSLAEQINVGQAMAYQTARWIIAEEFAKEEEEESNHLWIIEFRTPGGKWQIFDMDGDRSRERAESYIPSNQVAYPDCEFRVVKYQRVEGE